MHKSLYISIYLLLPPGPVSVRAVYEVPRAAGGDSGRYVCGGVNAAGGVGAELRVRVRVPLQPPPIIARRPQDMLLLPGAQAAFYCR